MKKITAAAEEIKQVIKGKDIIVDKVLATMIARGHILLEDIPGVGKTTLAVAVANAMSLYYRRVQFTPDVLPSDIVGFSMYNKQTEEFEYKPGAIVCNLFLADEINRTSPKTQSALLEVMEERKVTVDGVTRRLQEPFTVIATENPLGSSGTQKLPESQLDRFMVCLSMGYPEHSDAIRILQSNAGNPIEHMNAVLTAEEMMELQKQADEVHVSDAIYDYIVTLTEKTRTWDTLAVGVSPRGSIALLRMAKAVALLRDRDYVVPEDIYYIFNDVFGHRVKLSPKGRADGLTVSQALEEVFRSVMAPGT